MTKVLIFGATGMVGQGALRECLLDPGVEQVVCVGRAHSGGADPKLRDIVLSDLFAVGEREAELTGFDACFFCLGVSVVGLAEADYTRVTYQLPVTVAEVLARLNPGMTFVHVSAQGADERSRFMWARVKGRTERALGALPFKATYILRPGFIQPLHGIKSKTGWYNVLYALTAPLASALATFFPAAATTTEKIGRAMIAVTRDGYSKKILESADVNLVAIDRGMA